MTISDREFARYALVEAMRPSISPPLNPEAERYIYTTLDVVFETGVALGLQYSQIAAIVRSVDAALRDLDAG